MIIDKDCKNLFCQPYETVVPNVYMNNPAEHRGYSFLFNKKKYRLFIEIGVSYEQDI